MPAHPHSPPDIRLTSRPILTHHPFSSRLRSIANSWGRQHLTPDIHIILRRSLLSRISLLFHGPLVNTTRIPSSKYMTSNTKKAWWTWFPITRNKEVDWKGRRDVGMYEGKSSKSSLNPRSAKAHSFALLCTFFLVVSAAWCGRLPRCYSRYDSRSTRLIVQGRRYTIDQMK
jgi:hypothetical protein